MQGMTRQEAQEASKTACGENISRGHKAGSTLLSLSESPATVTCDCVSCDLLWLDAESGYLVLCQGLEWGAGQDVGGPRGSGGSTAQQSQQRGDPKEDASRIIEDILTV